MEVTVQGGGQGETGPYSEEDQILLDQDAQDQAEEGGEQEEAPQSYEEYAGEFVDIAPQLDEMGYEIHEEHPGEGWEEVSPEEIEAIRRGEPYEEPEEEGHDGDETESPEDDAAETQVQRKAVFYEGA